MYRMDRCCIIKRSYRRKGMIMIVHPALYTHKNGDKILIYIVPVHTCVQSTRSLRPIVWYPGNRSTGVQSSVVYQDQNDIQQQYLGTII